MGIWRFGVVLAALWGAVAAGATTEGFEDKLARIDSTIRTQGIHIASPILDSCLARRESAVRLYNRGQHARAMRSLDFCIQLMGVPAEPQVAAAPKGPTMEEVQAKAALEVEKALALEPDVARGLEIYRDCALCHQPEGWGMKSGVVPQIAGQHRGVVIKQLADIRAGNRQATAMLPYSSVEAIGGPQAVADVSAYIDTLEISTANGKGSGKDLDLGERLYGENCTRCHGAAGEGDPEKYAPRIQSQHYGYLLREFESIRDGKRRNADPEMTAQIKGFDEKQMKAVLDYVSRLEPPEDLRAPPDWRNPDFVN